jgi:hypothetical protein
MGFPTTNARRRLQEPQEPQQQDDDACLEVDPNSIDQWWVVYELTFVNGIRKAWFGDAKFLAILIIVFSGIWPYAKNLILIYIWYRPMTVKTRTSVLTWLLRLSKYTLVDVFAVICVLVGVLLQLNVAGVDVVTRAEPRPAIIAFLVATVWEFTQIEWTVHLHNRHIPFDDDKEDKKEEEDNDQEKEEGNVRHSNNHNHNNGPTIQNGDDDKKDGDDDKEDTDQLLDAMRFRTKLSSNEECVKPSNLFAMTVWVFVLLVTSIALYVAGATTDLIRFRSSSASGLAPSGEDETAPCEKSYNLVTFGNAMLSDLAMTNNSAKPGTWTLYISYVVLVLLLPIDVHILQIIILTCAVLGVDKKKYEKVCRVTSSLWGFSCIEVLLMGLFAIEYRFEKFVKAIGGENAEFIEVTSDLGTAFYIFIAYAVTSGLLQYFIHCADSEYYKIDPYHKVHVVWTQLFGCWLEKKKD